VFGISLVVTTSVIASRLKLKTTKSSSFLNEHLALINGWYAEYGREDSRSELHWGDGGIQINFPINSVYRFGVCYFYIYVAGSETPYHADHSEDFPPSQTGATTEHIG
jgi:hypothetical protein